MKTKPMTHHRLYPVWCAMKRRCENKAAKAYPDYGGRGIKVCDRWRSSFAAFLADIGDRPSSTHTLERKNNDGDYEPGNVVWATHLQQGNNKRNNRLIRIDGTTQTLAEWARVAGITESGMRRRLKNGITGKDLLAPSSLSKHTYRGETKTLAAWSKETNIKLRTLSSRIYVYGWDLARALTTKVAR